MEDAKFVVILKSACKYPVPRALDMFYQLCESFAQDQIMSLVEYDDFLKCIKAILSEECELTEVDSYTNVRETVHVLECSACGETCEHVNGSYPKCPHCGRMAVKQGSFD